MKLSVSNRLSYLVCSVHPQLGVAARHWVPTCMKPLLPGYAAWSTYFCLRIITEGTAVQVPPYVIHRDPRYFFPHPDKFWPDRWLKQDLNIILNRSAFIPFSTGSANCPGKPLAMIELRLMTCLIVRTFELSFEDGYDPLRWEEGLLDRFVIVKGKLPVKLKTRSSWSSYKQLFFKDLSIPNIYQGHFMELNTL